eukprot:scaffold322355_cov19-Prasinocladus_malaysianus.AAC.1
MGSYPSLDNVCHDLTGVHAVKVGDVAKGVAALLVPPLNDVLDLSQGLDGGGAAGVLLHDLPDSKRREI